jgi:hypothetical protein
MSVSHSHELTNKSIDMVAQITPPGIENLGYKFWIIWAVICFSFIPTTYFFYPETANRSLEGQYPTLPPNCAADSLQISIDSSMTIPRFLSSTTRSRLNCTDPPSTKKPTTKSQDATKNWLMIAPRRSHISRLRRSPRCEALSNFRSLRIVVDVFIVRPRICCVTRLMIEHN